MAFKAFFSRITSSFKFCRPLFIDCQPDTPLPFKSHRSSFKHHVSSIFGCGFRTHEDDLPESPACKWDETPRHDYNSSISGDSDNELFPPPPPSTLTRHPITDEKEEIVTLPSFSLNPKKRVKKLLPLFPAEGKVKDSFAVVKESVDPYEDFKASMMEMILAKQLFEERDFEQLLECFLSLNLRHHYGARVVWPLSDDSCRRVPHCISDYLQLTAKLPSERYMTPKLALMFGWGIWERISKRKWKRYKIVVDDQWRHDEHQPFENGNYGTVNTVFLARESNYVPGILNPQMHSGSNMDVDNEAFQRLVRVSGGPLHEALPRVSEADLEIHVGIPMAPLGDFCKGQFVGVLSALDFIMIVRELGSHGSNPIEEELETHTISAWKDAKSYLSRQIDGNGRLFPRQLVHARPDENLKDVPLKILQNNVATVSVIHSSSGNASILQLLHLASLSRILKCTLNVLLGHYRCSNYQSVQFLWVPGFRELGKQIDGHCLSYDINALAKDKIYTHINLEEMTINQLGQYSPYGSSSQRCHMCLRSDPLHKVMERLANPV
ncbi:unnamed protein product [Camellia sinensis]